MSPSCRDEGFAGPVAHSVRMAMAINMSALRSIPLQHRTYPQASRTCCSKLFSASKSVRNMSVVFSLVVLFCVRFAFNFSIFKNQIDRPGIITHVSGRTAVPAPFPALPSSAIQAARASRSAWSVRQRPGLPGRFGPDGPAQLARPARADRAVRRCAWPWAGPRFSGSLSLAGACISLLGYSGRISFC